MTEKVLEKKDIEKFFFHKNIFDEEEVEEEIEDPPPPPPTFSEEELAEARKSGYEKGKRDGIAEATKAEKESRSQFVASVLQRIGDETATLYAQEHERAKLYEDEVAGLCLKIFEKLFPVYNEHHGFDELTSSIGEILQKQKNQIEIKIQVQPDIVDAIQKMVGALGDKGFETKFSVLPDETLSDGACRMSWNNGGALRDPENLAEQIKALMQQTLAGKATNRHDEDDSVIKNNETIASKDHKAEEEKSDERQKLDNTDDADTTGEN